MKEWISLPALPKKKRITKKCYEQLYLNKLEHLDELANS
jgi:hypothetical protein